MQKNNSDNEKNMRKLNWQVYDWRKFEKICFEYVKTVYSAQFYRTQLTRAQKDHGRDIIIKAKNRDFEAWGECKNHKRNLDLAIIGKNIVLALSHQINKAIFFSVTSITINTKIEILTVAQKYGFEVLFLDGNLLDETILSCPQVARKYFRKEYEKFVMKNTNNIWIDAFLSEYPFAEDAQNNVKIQYHLQNGFRVYLHIFIKNMRTDSIENIAISLESISETDMIFYETEYHSETKLFPLSDLMHTFGGLVFSAQKNIHLPNVNVICTLNNGSIIRETIAVGELDASDVWKAPYINSQCNFFMNETARILQEIVPQNYARVFYIYGNSGTGKSRLMNEIENKAYENSYRVIHIDFRKKQNMISLQDLITELLSLPSSKNKINIDLSKFVDIFKNQIDEESLYIIYDFLYKGTECATYNGLTNAIINIIINISSDTPILISLDNIQELSREWQMLFWNILEYCREISIPICFIISHNTERNSHTKHVLIEYLSDIGNEKENYILSYMCDDLNLQDAVLLIQQLLHLTPESDECIKQVLKQNGTLPMDILLLSKSLSQQEQLFKKIGDFNYITNPQLLITHAKLISVSTEYLIKNRLENLATDCDKCTDYWPFFSLICYFDGNLPIEIYDKCGFDENLLYTTNNNLITKVNCKENLITFYHEKFFVFFSKQSTGLSINFLETICSCYFIYNNETIVSSYHFVNSLIALKKNNDAIIYGIRSLDKYRKEHQSRYVSSLCDELLEIIDPLLEPVQYFHILFLQADTWLENVNISEAEKLFEEAYNIIKEKYSLFTAGDITHFFHRYINQKLHTLQYDKAIQILKEFEKMDNLTPNASLIINDRYCVAYYSLGMKQEALDKIEDVIECAYKNHDNTWLSIAYSDKAFVYFFNSRDIDEITSNFKKAIEYFEICDEKETISRKIEIASQTSIVRALKNDIPNAIICIQKAINIAEQNAHGYLLIPVLNIYVYLLMMQEDVESAIPILKRALSYANVISNQKALISIYNNLGNIYVQKKMYPEALEYFIASYHVLKKMCFPMNSFRYRGLICNIAKIAAYLHNEIILDEISDKYSFDELANYINLYLKASNIESISCNAYGNMGCNGWDYLYY